MYEKFTDGSTTKLQDKPLIETINSRHISNLHRWEKMFEESGLDAVVAVSPENVPYLSGVYIDTQRTIRDRLALVLWSAISSPVLIVCNIEEPQASAESWIEDIRAYVEFQQSPIDLLAQIVEEKGLANKRIGIELGYLSAKYFAELQSLLPNADFVACENIFELTRLVKTPAEIELLQHGARMTEKALLATFSSIAEGNTEKIMANRLNTNLLEGGADEIGFLYINAGPNTGYPHCKATDYKAQLADIVKSDVGGNFRGYHSDVARTGVIGKPTSHQLSIYRRLIEVHRRTIESARMGNTAADVFNTARAAYKDVGLPFPLPHAGHSVGNSVHEWPMLSPTHDVELLKDVVLYIESRVRWKGVEGYHIEDLIHITDEGPKVLTTYFPTAELFII